MSDRVGQEPAIAGAGASSRAAGPPRPRPECRLAGYGAFSGCAPRVAAARPGGLHNRCRGPVSHSTDDCSRFRRDARPGGSQIHVDHQRVESRFGPLRLGVTVAGAGLLAQNQKTEQASGPPAKIEAARAADVPVQEVKPEKLRIAIVGRGSVEASRNYDAVLQGRGTDNDHRAQAGRIAGPERRGRLRARLEHAQGSARQPEDCCGARRERLQECRPRT